MAAEAAMAATSDIPIVFLAGLDPRQVAWRRADNVTGVSTNPDRLRTHVGIDETREEPFDFECEVHGIHLYLPCYYDFSIEPEYL